MSFVQMSSDASPLLERIYQSIVHTGAQGMDQTELEHFYVSNQLTRTQLLEQLDQLIDTDRIYACENDDGSLFYTATGF